jgi:hypothetical protein
VYRPGKKGHFAVIELKRSETQEAMWDLKEQPFSAKKLPAFNTKYRMKRNI